MTNPVHSSPSSSVETKFPIQMQKIINKDGRNFSYSTESQKEKLSNTQLFLQLCKAIVYSILGLPSFEFERAYRFWHEFKTGERTIVTIRLGDTSAFNDKSGNKELVELIHHKVMKEFKFCEIHYEEEAIQNTGKFELESGEIWEGTIEQGLLQGKGVKTYPQNGLEESANRLEKEEGTFKDSELQTGIRTSTRRSIYGEEFVREEGTFEKGQLQGQGTRTTTGPYKNVAKEEGIFEKGQLQGQGTRTKTDPYGNIAKEEGTFEKGRLQGQGGAKTTTDCLGKIGHEERGLFEKGELHGLGMRKTISGESIEENGIFNQGRLEQGTCKTTDSGGIFRPAGTTIKEGTFALDQGDRVLIRGKQTFPDGSYHDGNFGSLSSFSRGLLDGTKMLVDGTIEEGTFNYDGLLAGKKIFPNGIQEEGTFGLLSFSSNERGLVKGTRTLIDGTKEEGTFDLNGLFKGTITNPSGTKITIDKTLPSPVAPSRPITNPGGAAPSRCTGLFTATEVLQLRLQMRSDGTAVSQLFPGRTFRAFQDHNGNFHVNEC